MLAVFFPTQSRTSALTPSSPPTNRPLAARGNAWTSDRGVGVCGANDTEATMATSFRNMPNIFLRTLWSTTASLRGHHLLARAHARFSSSRAHSSPSATSCSDSSVPSPAGSALETAALLEQRPQPPRRQLERLQGREDVRRRGRLGRRVGQRNGYHAVAVRVPEQLRHGVQKLENLALEDLARHSGRSHAARRAVVSRRRRA